MTGSATTLAAVIKPTATSHGNSDSGAITAAANGG